MRRRGFTLIELVVSLGIVGVLAMAMGSTIVLSMRALPTAGGGPETQASAGRTLQIIGSDVRLATAVSMPDVRTLTLTIPDQTGDASDETVTYAWAGTAGNPFTRTFNADTTTLLSSVNDMKFAAVTRSDIATDERTMSPTDRVRVTISISAAESTDVSAEFRLLNARIP